VRRRNNMVDLLVQSTILGVIGSIGATAAIVIYRLITGN